MAARFSMVRPMLTMLSAITPRPTQRSIPRKPLDLVFVLDINRDFQPWLVERSRLFSAMDTLDGDKKRGLLLTE